MMLTVHVMYNKYFISFCFTTSHCISQDKHWIYGRVLSIQSWDKSGVLAYFGLKIGYFGHIYWDIDFKFVSPIISINIEGQTQLEVN